LKLRFQVTVRNSYCALLTVARDITSELTVRWSKRFSWTCKLLIVDFLALDQCTSCVDHSGVDLWSSSGAGMERPGAWQVFV